MIVLRILQGSLAASKAYFNIKIQSKQIFDKNIQVQFETDREDLKTALNASQDSAAVHILLEVLADFDKNPSKLASALALRETQGIICSFIHQSFISEPSLAKLVHFQTYPRDVIPMIVMGVPSMHICIDFLHEFLSMPEIDKQVFTIELASHLALKYSIPKSLSISKFCINTIGTTLTLLSTDLKCKFLADILPALLRFAEAFPVLIDDCINILMMIGRCLYSQETLGFNVIQTHLILTTKCKRLDTKKYISLIEEAFQQLIAQLLSKTDLY